MLARASVPWQMLLFSSLGRMSQSQLFEPPRASRRNSRACACACRLCVPRVIMLWCVVMWWRCQDGGQQRSIVDVSVLEALRLAAAAGQWISSPVTRSSSCVIGCWSVIDHHSSISGWDVNNILKSSTLIETWTDINVPLMLDLTVFLTVWLIWCKDAVCSVVTSQYFTRPDQ